jgi:hypothetical protein
MTTKAKLSMDLSLPANYVARDVPDYHDDFEIIEPGVTWQPDVYAYAGAVAAWRSAELLIDIGCGQGTKLAKLQVKRRVGIDWGSNLEACRARYSWGEWVAIDLERPDLDAFESLLKKGALVVCSDVVEHLIDPRPLVKMWRLAFEKGAIVITSTPDRMLYRGANDLGPPENPAHVREWTLEEYLTFLDSQGLPLTGAGYTVNNDYAKQLKTIITVHDGQHALQPNVDQPAPFLFLDIQPWVQALSSAKNLAPALKGEGGQLLCFPLFGDGAETLGAVSLIGQLAGAQQAQKSLEGECAALRERLEEADKIKHEWFELQLISLGARAREADVLEAKLQEAEQVKATWFEPELARLAASAERVSELEGAVREAEAVSNELAERDEQLRRQTKEAQEWESAFQHERARLSALGHDVRRAQDRATQAEAELREMKKELEAKQEYLDTLLRTKEEWWEPQIAALSAKVEHYQRELEQERRRYQSLQESQKTTSESALRNLEQERQRFQSQQELQKTSSESALRNLELELTRERKQVRELALQYEEQSARRSRAVAEESARLQQALERAQAIISQVEGQRDAALNSRTLRLARLLGRVTGWSALKRLLRGT